MKKIKVKSVSGERGLLCAVIAAAVNDVVSGNLKQRNSALVYFSGDVYQHHLKWLNLPADWLPTYLEDAGILINGEKSNELQAGQTKRETGKGTYRIS